MKAIRQRLENFWAQRDAREQRILILGGALGLPMLLILLVVQPLISGHSAAMEKLSQKTDDLLWMQAASGRVKASRATAAQSGGGALTGNPATVITRAAAQLGLNISRIEPKNDGSINLWMSKAAYAETVEFLDGLQLQGFVVDNLTLSSHDESGFVVLRATLSRGAG